MIRLEWKTGGLIDENSISCCVQEGTILDAILDILFECNSFIPELNDDDGELSLPADAKVVELHVRIDGDNPTLMAVSNQPWCQLDTRRLGNMESGGWLQIDSKEYKLQD